MDLQDADLLAAHSNCPTNLIEFYQTPFNYPALNAVSKLFSTEATLPMMKWIAKNFGMELLTLTQPYKLAGHFLDLDGLFSTRCSTEIVYNWIAKVSAESRASIEPNEVCQTCHKVHPPLQTNLPPPAPHSPQTEESPAPIPRKSSRATASRYKRTTIVTSTSDTEQTSLEPSPQPPSSDTTAPVACICAFHATTTQEIGKPGRGNKKTYRSARDVHPSEVANFVQANCLNLGNSHTEKDLEAILNRWITIWAADVKVVRLKIKNFSAAAKVIHSALPSTKSTGQAAPRDHNTPSPLPRAGAFKRSEPDMNRRDTPSVSRSTSETKQAAFNIVRLLSLV